MRKIIPELTDKDLVARFITQLNQQATKEILDELTANQYSHNSLLAMVKDWNLFHEFCTLKQVTALPASVTAVRLFIEHEASRRKYSTIRRYVVTIGLIHRILALKDPTSNPQVLHTMNFYRAEKKNDAKDTVAFEKKHLEKLNHRLCHSQHASDIRNLAVYFLMFECALKRSELKQLTLADMHVDDENTIAIQIGSQTYPLSVDAVTALKNWCELLPSLTPDTPLFSAIDRHGNIKSTALDDSSIYRIQRAASTMLGLEVWFSGQSSRVGKVKDLAKQGLKLKEIQFYGRWLSPAMPYQYLGDKGNAEAEMVVFKRFKPID